MTQGFLVEPLELPTASQALTTSMPLETSPKTVCFPSSQEVTTVVMKNWDPLVLGPALAMDRSPGLLCFLMKFSSLNLEP